MRKLLEGRYVTLVKEGANAIAVRVADQMAPHSMAYDCEVVWGAKGKVTSGVMTVTPGSVVMGDDGSVQAMAFTIGLSDPQATDSQGFKGFWGINTQYTGVAVNGMKYELSGLFASGQMTQGAFKASTTYSATGPGNKDITDEPKEVEGTVYIDDAAHAGLSE